MKLTVECRSLGYQVIDAALQSPGSDFALRAAIFTARATTAMQSVEVLATAGMNADATSVARTILEIAIDLTFIAKERTEERLDLFFGHEGVRDWHKARAVSRLHGGKVSAEAMAELEAKYDEVRGDYRKEFEWCGTLARRARCAGLQAMYDLPYAEASAASHSGPQGLRLMYSIARDDESECLTIFAGPQDPSERPVTMACMAYICTLDNAISLASLTPQFGDKVSDLAKRLMSMPSAG